MKRFLLTLSVILIALIAYATPPNLSVEQFFDGRYNNDKTVEIYIYRDQKESYRTFKVSNNPTIVKQVLDALQADSQKSANYSERIKGGRKNYRITVYNNGKNIDIGFGMSVDGKSATLMINGPISAFK
ncbi:MAG: hypothetical protein K2K79_05240 [Paramuribaculum sp.]|nr:hypothetical protein [Paramuribaculum sp.]